MLDFPTPLLCLITDEYQDPRSVERKTADACDAGCRLVQLRNRILGARSLLEHAERLREITAERGALFAVNAGSEVPAELRPDAIHIPAYGPPAAHYRETFGDRIGLGRSIHSAEEIDGFANDHPDYFHFGPVFATASKARYGPPRGVELLRETAARVRRVATSSKLIAVGGIDCVTAPGAIENGADGVAVIGAIMSAEDAAEATYELLNALRGAGTNR